MLAVDETLPELLEPEPAAAPLPLPKAKVAFPVALLPRAFT